MVKISSIVIGAILSLMILGNVFGWFGETLDVAHDEFGPKAALTKYEWFIDQYQRINKMDADIKVFESRVAGVESQYAGYGTDQTQWSLAIQTQYNQERQRARDDLIAIVSQRNNLVREYDAASGKFNWQSFKTDPRKPVESIAEYIVP